MHPITSSIPCNTSTDALVRCARQSNGSTINAQIKLAPALAEECTQFNQNFCTKIRFSYGVQNDK